MPTGNAMRATLLLSAVAYFTLGVGCMAASLATMAEMPIWSGSAPGSEGLGLEIQEIERSKDPALKDRASVKILNPTLTPYPAREPNGASVIIMPGGAYERVVTDKEGVDLADIFTQRGVTVFVLKYRLPAEGHANRQWVPLQDAQRAVRVVRAKAAEWGLDPNRIGVMGFSAGGHLAAMTGVSHERKTYEAKDDIDRESARPDFMALLYPVISMDPEITHAGSGANLLGPTITAEMREEMSADLHVAGDTPTAFIVHANDDDAVPAENSLRMFQALRKADVSAQLLIFAKGGHGFGIRNAKSIPAGKWPDLFLDWLGSLK